MVLRRVGVISCGKLLGIMYAAMGLLLGGMMSLAFLVGAMANAPRRPGNEDLFLSVFFGAGAVIALPIFYGIMGFIGGIIMAAIYNFVAGIVGGLELELEPRTPQY